jgi:hypothetical protein
MGAADGSHRSPIARRDARPVRAPIAAGRAAAPASGRGGASRGDGTCAPAWGAVEGSLAGPRAGADGAIARLMIALALPLGCGSPATPPVVTPARAAVAPVSPLHEIMAAEVNDAYSALSFLVFHAEGGPDFPAITARSEVLRGGFAKVRALPALPPQSDAAREVFFTYIDSIAGDADRFRQAIGARDHAQMAATLARIGRACNHCHHFFRLDIQDAAVP